MNRQTQAATSQARLRINATESANYSCRAENVHKHGRASVSRSAFVRVLGQSPESSHFTLFVGYIYRVVKTTGPL